MARILGVDFGKSKIGLALSDPSHKIASPLKTVRASQSIVHTVSLLLQELTKIDEGVERIVVGLPLALSGRDSDSTRLVRMFASLLQERGRLPVVLWDERLSTVEVEKILKEGNVKRRQRAKHLDTMSATLILQTYLNSKGPSEEWIK